MRLLKLAPAMVLAFCITAAPAARAEVSEVNLAMQNGIAYMPLMAMQQLKFIEKQAAQRGLGDLKVNWTRLAGPAVIVDAVLAGKIDFAAQGPPSLILLWDKTKGTIGVRGVGAMCTAQIYLNTRNPNVKTLRDFTDKDRIAVPSVKISSQAILLQIAAEKEFGPGNHAKLDHLTVSLAHPDALAAVLNPVGEMTSHMATTPFHETEIKAGLRTITSAFQIMDGPVTTLTFASTEKFSKDNPKVFEAVAAAYDETLAWLNADKRRAAKMYIEVAQERKTTEDEIFEQLSAEGFEYTNIPRKFSKLAEFMYKTGLIKTEPNSWQDMYFPAAQKLAGD